MIALMVRTSLFGIAILLLALAGVAEDKVPADGDARAAWILDRLREVAEGSKTARVRAVDALIRGDKSADCTTPLLKLLGEHKKNTALLIDVIRGVGRDGLNDAALVLPGFLSHKDAAVRANAAVSLEYIGCTEKNVVAALRKAAGKEKDEEIANHMYRALGRCGVKDKAARSTLLKKCGSAKTEFASYGPAIGLAYFKGDKRVARGVEKIVRKVGVPGGRGSDQNMVKRGVFCWTLASIGDPKSAKMIREELLARLKNVKALWVPPLRSFYRVVAYHCEGADKMSDIEEGVRGFAAFAKGANPGRYQKEARSMMDEYRKGREAGGFTPKGDYLLGAAGAGAAAGTGGR